MVAVMECLKNCCKNFMRKKEKEQETQVITMKIPPNKPDEGRRGVTEDYLLSKLPPDGREVPFVLPTFKASYIQPRGSRFPNLQSGLQSMYQQTQNNTMPICLSFRMHIYPVSLNILYVPSSTSSMKDSVESSLESITLSGDERELGKVCVQLSYQEALEQVWITLVQCSDLNLPSDGVEQQKISFKGIITTGKPIQFKTSVKEYHQDVTFMETFVFALRLQQLRCSALVLRLQTYTPRKRTVAECVLSLRQLSPQETQHCLDLHPPSKSSVCHSELHLATCFQPVNGRIQVQILAAQNLPASSSPLTQAFFVKVEMHQMDRVVMKKKTRVMKASGGQCQWAETFYFLLAALDHACSLSIKLYSRSSVRRKQCLGQVHLGFDSSAPDAVDQWKDTMAHPEKVVSAWHHLSAP
uniref:C2 domain-containing protein n=1 Tax=Sphaeramia orbicularis TaxID=375764 RepID=A0A673BXI6_9TELE